MRELRPHSILHAGHAGPVASFGAAARRMGLGPTRLLALALAAAALASPRALRAQCTEQSFQNHTGGGTVACACFVPNEQAGAVFQLPANVYPVEILKVGIGWASQFGGAAQSLEEAIHVYAGGLPNPGTPIFSLGGPVLTDGVINEFDLGALPGEIVIASGPFTVTLEFLNQNVLDPFAPTVVHDGNGCQSGKNVVFAVPGGWTNACALGIGGDWVFYVTYRSLKVTAQANPDRTVFSNPPPFQTTCDTVYVVNTGCDDLTIEGISGCGSAPFSVDTTMTSHTVPAGESTPILVCVTPTSGNPDSCLVTVASNASNPPTTFRVVIDAVTAVDRASNNGFDIVGVVPNPFNPSTEVRFTLPAALPVTAEVWTVSGARVRTLARNATFAPGQHGIRWDGRNSNGERVASGVYLFRVSTPLGKRIARMVLVQ
jgi:hypothetical protein